MKGFRKGKAPLPLLQQDVRSESVMGETVQETCGRFGPST